MTAKHPESVTNSRRWHWAFNRAFNMILSTMNPKSKWYESDKREVEDGLRGKSIDELRATYNRIMYTPSAHEINMATSGNMVVTA